MISQTTFVRIMDAIRKQDALDNRNGKILTILADPDPEVNQNPVIFNTPIIPDLIWALATEIDPEHPEYCKNEIEHWVYELDYGKESERLTMKRADGSIIPSKTVNDLYKWLMECKENKDVL